MNAWDFACPECRAPLPGHAASNGCHCPNCSAHWLVHQGIWRCLGAARQAAHAAFLDDYRALRADEARGSDTSAYYRALPQVPANDPLAWQWSIRSRTFDAFLVRVLAAQPNGLRIVDCGAGCGWFSHQMRCLGHFPCSFDINLDDSDGLGAQRHFDPDWPVIQADFDALPIADASADLVVYNGSLHYAADYVATLSEALRILTPAGQVVILDSPIYRRPEDGRRMRTERRDAYEKRYGRPWRADTSLDYLDYPQVRAIAEALSLEITIHPVWYGWRWLLTHLRARWFGPRELVGICGDHREAAANLIRHRASQFHRTAALM